MSMWHADTNAPALNQGARVLVLSSHRVVRVLTADQLSIQTPSGDRVSAVVLDRTGAQMRLSFAEGDPISLSMISDESLERRQVGEEFSRQVWIVN
jgi:hypothetical protein